MPNANSTTKYESKSSELKEKCRLNHKYGHKREDCKKFKTWLEKKGIPLAFAL